MAGAKIANSRTAIAHPKMVFRAFLVDANRKREINGVGTNRIAIFGDRYGWQGTILPSIDNQIAGLNVKKIAIARDCCNQADANQSGLRAEVAV